MATMIPDIDPGAVANNGERLFYQACGDLPRGYTCLYSYKYRTRYNVYGGRNDVC